MRRHFRFNTQWRTACLTTFIAYFLWGHNFLFTSFDTRLFFSRTRLGRKTGPCCYFSEWCTISVLATKLMQRAFFIKEYNLIQLRYINAVLSKNRTKPINSLCGENSEMLNVKANTTHSKPSTMNSKSTGYATYKTTCSFSLKNYITHIHLLSDVTTYNYMSREGEIKQ